jgi:hypothetical protein
MTIRRHSRQLPGLARETDRLRQKKSVFSVAAHTRAAKQNIYKKDRAALLLNAMSQRLMRRS